MIQVINWFYTDLQFLCATEYRRRSIDPFKNDRACDYVDWQLHERLQKVVVIV